MTIVPWLPGVCRLPGVRRLSGVWVCLEGRGVAVLDGVRGELEVIEPLEEVLG